MYTLYDIATILANLNDSETAIFYTTIDVHKARARLSLTAKGPLREMGVFPQLHFVQEKEFYAAPLEKGNITHMQGHKYQPIHFAELIKIFGIDPTEKNWEKL